jgi:RND family efflux transporter MFP subunit
MTEPRHAGLALHPLESGAETDPQELPKRRQILRRTKIAVVVVLLLLALGAGRTVFLRAANARALAAAAPERSAQYVKTVQPQPGSGSQSISLPGSLQGAVQAPIAARASGYLKRWTHDIGSRVAKGELLAEIDTPEIDQQLGQAIAARDQAAASLNLAQTTVDRWEALRKKDVVSQQELEERRSAVVQARANQAAAEANVQRLRQTEAFRRITAPFAGVITRRNVDVGDLIDAGAGRPLFVLAQTDPLRVTINVPQSAAQRVKPGQAVVVTQAELPGRRFAGTVARTAGAIDPATRAMQVDVTLPNADGTLLPGAFVQVALPLPQARSLVVPNNALLFRAEGARVAVVDAQGRIALRAVTLGRNYGDTVQVREGVSESDRLVLNPSDSLADGDIVVVAPVAASAAPSAASGSSQ